VLADRGEQFAESRPRHHPGRHGQVEADRRHHRPHGPYRLRPQAPFRSIGAKNRRGLQGRGDIDGAGLEEAHEQGLDVHTEWTRATQVWRDASTHGQLRTHRSLSDVRAVLETYWRTENVRLPHENRGRNRIDKWIKT
jgi:hypothetical protein